MPLPEQIAIQKRITKEDLLRRIKTYEGLISRYAGGKPSKLSTQQKEKLLLLLNEKDV